LVYRPIQGNILRSRRGELQNAAPVTTPHVSFPVSSTHPEVNDMAKPHHKLKKANHGQRPANGKARKAKRKKIKT